METNTGLTKKTLNTLCQKASTNRHELSYDLSKGKRYALIFNHIKYKLNSLQPLDERIGTGDDVVKLKKILETKGFTTESFTDLKYLGIIEALKHVSNMDKLSCLIIVIMSHGIKNAIYAYDTRYEISDIWKPFIDKQMDVPKLFFIQACRGNNVDSGGFECDGPDEDDSCPLETNDAHMVPLMCDFLLMYSTYEGYKSWRVSNGAWFVEALCQVLEDDVNNECELLELLTYVNRKVAQNYKTKTYKRETCDKKQMPEIVTTLTKFLYFK